MAHLTKGEVQREKIVFFSIVESGNRYFFFDEKRYLSGMGIVSVDFSDGVIFLERS